MLSIDQFNERAFNKNGCYVYFLIVFLIIIILNIFSLMYYFFNLAITVRVKYYKTNLQIIHQAIYATCPFSSVILIIEKIFDVMEKSEVLTSDSSLFMYKQYFRTAIMCPPLFALTAIMLERIFATWFIKDYEQKQRHYIAYGIIALMTFISMLTAYVFNSTNLIFAYVGAHFLLNIVCYIVSIITYRINRNWYNDNRENKHDYSLGTRFQISENIKVYKFFSHYLFVLAFFPFTCTACALFIQYDSSPLHREIMFVVFDLSFTLLCILAPYLILKTNEPWQNDLEQILSKAGILRASKVETILERSKTLKNTFGEAMEFETSQHSDMYFNQLQKSWNKESNRVVLV
ncbi:Serpentine Receptor, class E (Epsilon) [Caenorhabditis elegans]|uniref:Serpentine Receptor, class E (Epsilon) n=1 Tax=Caenorhabditis elegans TaxID=6239 RepID=Q9U2L5_CAEEL|nr:Serpentine Receptor, class E (Epsilon) [Caenorhabditis elegans]CAB60491.1 Serpentine Receptor, class E (Epsilon) [Caenorhabditis elegans]|eukprot:NP_502324.1 Serpentine Receptor, class E (epsilon) [Caenorhabditis elegans]